MDNDTSSYSSIVCQCLNFKLSRRFLFLISTLTDIIRLIIVSAVIIQLMTKLNLVVLIAGALTIGSCALELLLIPSFIYKVQKQENRLREQIQILEYILPTKLLTMAFFLFFCLSYVLFCRFVSKDTNQCSDKQERTTEVVCHMVLMVNFYWLTRTIDKIIKQIKREIMRAFRGVEEERGHECLNIEFQGQKLSKQELAQLTHDEVPKLSIKCKVGNLQEADCMLEFQAYKMRNLKPKIDYVINIDPIDESMSDRETITRINFFKKESNMVQKNVIRSIDSRLVSISNSKFSTFDAITQDLISSPTTIKQQGDVQVESKSSICVNEVVVQEEDIEKMIL